jgi:hypothetical protein
VQFKRKETAQISPKTQKRYKYKQNIIKLKKPLTQMNKQEQILEGNKLIAEFMGMQFLSTHIDSHNYEQYSYSMPDELSKQVYGYTDATCFLSDEQFHISWDWLMPVVEKIGELNCIVEITTSKQCRIFTTKDADKPYWNITNGKMIEAVWQAVVEFIKRYNNQTITK